ncbi:hypothetical protein A9Q99_09330 [Gammaproteobacteria bacterium 45_16_T64]|nr:hypothetical protein A9Q99_09330 [Gammaproteobacteria bacterium 45_16_T64]
MPLNNLASPFVVLVNFTTTPQTQKQALISIRRYIKEFLSQQPGFISATLHEALDGLTIVNYAHWESAADFKAFAQKAKSHPDLSELLTYKPTPNFYRVTDTF